MWAASVITRSESIYASEILYASYRFDPETGLYQVRFRYYHPTMGRWVARDALQRRDARNTYSYSGQNPLGRLDPTGLVEILYEGCNLREYDTRQMAQLLALQQECGADAACAKENLSAPLEVKEEAGCFRVAIAKVTWSITIHMPSNESFLSDLNTVLARYGRNRDILGTVPNSAWYNMARNYSTWLTAWNHEWEHATQIYSAGLESIPATVASFNSNKLLLFRMKQTADSVKDVYEKTGGAEGQIRLALQDAMARTYPPGEGFGPTQVGEQEAVKAERQLLDILYLSNTRRP